VLRQVTQGNPLQEAQLRLLPAGLSARSRSAPTSPPSTTASSNLITRTGALISKGKSPAL